MWGSTFILQTKINRPGVTRDLVVRPRLLQRLNAGLDGAMTLVVAPAGFGKTTLVSSWIQTLSDPSTIAPPIPAAWLNLDEGDGHRDVFLAYFIAALQTIFPGAFPETLKLLNARQSPPEKLVFSMLTNELDRLPSRFIVVLDDLHTSNTGQEIINYLNDWLHHWPSRMHLVMLSRINPPLPLASLRGKGLLTEIRSSDLRFSPSETAEYFQRILGYSSDEIEISLLQERLEGWIAGLKMALLSMSGRDDARTHTSFLTDGNVYVADYLADEVFAMQKPAIQNFLLKTSIADRFCASLGEALLDKPDPECTVREHLDFLEAADLFLIPLDRQREWYRYHGLFRDLLRNKLAESLAPAQIDELHFKAAEWFAAHNLIEQAIAHALETGSLELVAQFMQQGLRDVLNREDRSTLERWLTLVPDTFIQQTPELLVMRGFVHALRFEHDRLARVCEQVEALMSDERSEGRQALRGAIALLKGLVFYHIRQPAQVMPYCQKALALLPIDWVYARGNAALYLGISLYAAGRAGEAEKFLYEEYGRYPDKTDGFALRLLQALAINAIQAGNYEIAERTAQLILRNCPRERLPVILGWGHYFLGFVNYEWNDLEAAARHFSIVGGMYFTALLANARNGMIGQALVQQALRREEDALEKIDRLRQMDLEYRGREEIDAASSRARLDLMQGQQEMAERWIDLYNELPTPLALPPWIESPHLTRARILIARNQTGDIQSALQILDIVGELAGYTYNTRVMIEVLALRALALMTQGNGDGARESLIRSVELARRGIFTRVYVDLGSQMQKLLRQIAGHAPVSKSVSRILSAFPGAEAVQTPAGLFPYSPPATQSDSLDDDELDERLTPRELEILALMAQPISFREIASRMSISYTTARRYTINVYSKFGVHSRWEAVDAAVRKGIISPR